MPRIAGIDIPENKRVVIALAYIRGVGKTMSKKVLDKAKVDENIRTKDLTETQIADIRSALESLNIPVEGELRKLISQSISRLTEIRAYRGIRHQKRLPARGQRTRSNARTKRGKRVAVGGMKRVLQKT